MAEKLDPKELVTFKELLISNSIQVDALCQLLIEEGLISDISFSLSPNRLRLNTKSGKSTSGTTLGN